LQLHSSSLYPRHHAAVSPVHRDIDHIGEDFISVSYICNEALGGRTSTYLFLGGDTIHFNQEPLGFFRKQVAWQQGVREMAPYPDTNSLPSLYLSTSVSPPFFLLTGKGSGLFPTTQSATCTLKMNDREWGW
jgi:hypothetical protein